MNNVISQMTPDWGGGVSEEGGGGLTKTPCILHLPPSRSLEKLCFRAEGGGGVGFGKKTIMQLSNNRSVATLANSCVESLPTHSATHSAGRAHENMLDKHVTVQRLTWNPPTLAFS